MANRSVQFRISDERRELWQRSADERGMELTEWVRFVCDNLCCRVLNSEDSPPCLLR